jgi:hypothetical protein
MKAMQQRQQSRPGRRLFTASELAEFEYCPLTWWYEQFEPLAQADNEVLFARLVELEHEHGAQAPALPEYKMVEQLLLRGGAFDEGRQQHLDHAEDVEEIEEEIRRGVTATGRMRALTVIVVVLVCLALALIVASVVLR